MDRERLFHLGNPSLHIVSMDEREFDILYLGLNLSHKDSVIKMIRGRKSQTASDFINEVAAVLQFPYYFGENGAAFDECIVDLGWLEGTSYLLMIRNADKLLSKTDEYEFQDWMLSLSEASEEWKTPNKFNPRNLPPTPFHTLFQCTSEDLILFQERLQKTELEFDIL